jgi:quinol monooxygenase YgiN
MPEDDKPFALVVRFTLRSGREAEFDQLVKDTVWQILRNEPGVMRYLCYQVAGQPAATSVLRGIRDPRSL